MDTSFFSGTQTFENFKPVIEQLVREVIQKSLPKTYELDPIPATLLSENLDVLLPTTINIMNHSLTTGTLPPDFKTAVVKPLLNKPSLDPNALSNYRPISNLPFLSTRLEKIVLRHLFAHIDTHNLLSVHQSTFREVHGTETALLNIVKPILCALDENKISVLLLLDLSAAFDTTDQEILLSHLDSYLGIHSTALSRFRSNISERKHTVMVQDNQSSTAQLDFGVPQGSKLGTVLFILYTTRLSLIIDKLSVNHEMSTDDTKLCKSVPHRVEMWLSWYSIRSACCRHRFDSPVRQEIFLLASTFGADSLTVSVKPRVQSHAFIYVCMLKIP